MIIDCISDLHGHYPKLEGGDLLIVAGDLTARDIREEYEDFFRWLQPQKYRKKILIAGNHDNQLKYLYRIPDEETDLEYLCDSGTEFEGLKIWGSPWTQWFEGVNPNCTAFMLKTEEELAEKWALIPDDVDILVTHSPAWGMKDGSNSEQRFGSQSLLKRMVKKPLFESLKLHVFGHIHEGYGKYDLRKFQIELGDDPTCVYVNASIVNEHYKPVNKPVRVIL